MTNSNKPTPKDPYKLQDGAGKVEHIKDNSDYLRGTIAKGLQNPLTGAMFDDDTMLIKFHGIYQQDDRDIRNERMDRKLEPEYSFMIRLRLPGGHLTAKQWIVADDIASDQTIQTIKLTTRQAIQFHGILKRNLAPTIQRYHEKLLDSIAGCGDVNRNVMCSPNPHLSNHHAEIYDMSRQISEHLMPTSKAYHEIFVDGKLLAGGEETIEPLYGKHYLPRKFKIAIAIPPYNDVDVHANDLAFIAIIENDKLVGYNVAVGGGMGMSHGDDTTYPRLASVIGFVKPEDVLDIAYHTVQIQRDFGNRIDRKLARFKYTIDKHSLEWFKAELAQRSGVNIADEVPYIFTTNNDRYGWDQDHKGRWHLTLFIEGGRVKDTEDYQIKTALRKVAELNLCDFRLTGNQNIILGNVAEKYKTKIEDILNEYHVLEKTNGASGIRKSAIACVAMNTCPLAMAEAERFIPELITRLDTLMEKYGLIDKAINIRMTGCPNGCGRPYLGEIGFVGKAIGRYNMYLGAAHTGERLNKLYKENIHESEIESLVEPILEDYSKNAQQDESFGDFVIRKNYIKATVQGLDFHS